MRIKDNSSKTKEEFDEISGIVEKIADKTLEQLERDGVFVFPNIVKEADDITSNQMILQGYNDSYRTGNVMGFLGLGTERLVIESRFSMGENDFFFQYLLEQVLDFPNIINMKTDANQDEQLFSMLLFLFPQYLKSASRKGIFKMYIRNEYSDENVRGTIDIARHIKKNVPFTGNVAYSQREYSYDNYLMELIRHTIDFIKRKPYGNRLLESVQDEVKLVIDATGDYKAVNRRKVVEANKKNVVRHAYFHEYRDLQQLCILILQNEKHQMGVGSKRVFGILFDGAWLWEEYVNVLVGDMFYHPRNKAGDGAQYLFQGNRKIGLIYPDFIGKDVGNRIIADAKYKPLDNIGNKDYLQVLAYMFRFDAKQGYYLYPEAGEEPDLILQLNKGSTYEGDTAPREDIGVIKHGLKIPNDVNTYSAFVEKIRMNEVVFKNTLKEDRIHIRLLDHTM